MNKKLVKVCDSSPELRRFIWEVHQLEGDFYTVGLTCVVTGLVDRSSVKSLQQWRKLQLPYGNNYSGFTQ